MTGWPVRIKRASVSAGHLPQRGCERHGEVPFIDWIKSPWNTSKISRGKARGSYVSMRKLSPLNNNRQMHKQTITHCARARSQTTNWTDTNICFTLHTLSKWVHSSSVFPFAGCAGAHRKQSVASSVWVQNYNARERDNRGFVWMELELFLKVWQEKLEDKYLCPLWKCDVRAWHVRERHLVTEREWVRTGSVTVSKSRLFGPFRLNRYMDLMR